MTFANVQQIFSCNNSRNNRKQQQKQLGIGFTAVRQLLTTIATWRLPALTVFRWTSDFIHSVRHCICAFTLEQKVQ